MNKKLIISIALTLITLIIGIVCLIIFGGSGNASTITIDINPSIELVVKNNNVIEANALNDDAKEVLNDLTGKNLDDSLDKLLQNLDRYGYLNGDIEIILYTEGDMDAHVVEDKINDALIKKEKKSHIIIIESISDEDKELAKENNISVSKAAYINSIIKEHKDIKIDDLKDKSVSELVNTQSSGNHCNKGYILDGDSCIKEINRVPAKPGNVCPTEYFEINGVCYRESGPVENGEFTCREGFKFENNDCVDTQTYKAHGKCDEGEYDGESSCNVKKVVGEAYEFCRDSGRTLYNHKCLATKPTINGGCLKGDMLYNGKCVNTRDDYYMAEWKCPNGFVKSNADGSLTDNDTHCYEESKVPVSSYYCNEGATLVGKECTITTKEAPRKEMVCKKGFTKLEDGRCINYNDTNKKEDGYYCEDPESRLEGNMCVIYERIEALH